MAGIDERSYPSGHISYRVRLRKKGIKTFNITFDDLSAACEWIENHEEKFYENPEKYFEWRNLSEIEMLKLGIKAKDNILKPKKRKL